MSYVSDNGKAGRDRCCPHSASNVRTSLIQWLQSPEQANQPRSAKRTEAGLEKVESEKSKKQRPIKVDYKKQYWQDKDAKGLKGMGSGECIFRTGFVPSTYPVAPTLRLEIMSGGDFEEGSITFCRPKKPQGNLMIPWSNIGMSRSATEESHY